MDTHRFAVREISKKVKAFYEENCPFGVYHGSTHSPRATHDPRAIIHTSDLTHILDINTENKFAMVEPNVPMDKLVKETLKYGLMPPVVPAFPGTTVGGTFAGTAGSSSSFKYGFFDRAVTWLEIVLLDGKITRASRQRNPELLSGMVGTMGTIGITTLLQVKLVRAARYVELSYLPVESAIEALDTINRCLRDPDNDFIEGLIYGEKASTFGVVAVGRLCAGKTHQKQRFSGAGDPWYYQHVLEAGDTTETVPLMDYLFRYDRGSFCMGRFCFGGIPLNKWTRWLTDSAMNSRSLAQTVQLMHWAEHFIIQDLVIPMEATFGFLQYLEDTLKIYPLRLCPIRQWPEDYAIMRPNPSQTSLFIGIGIRGYTEDTIKDAARFKEKNRQIERAVHQAGGMKWLHTRNYYTEKEFWDIYPRQEYETLRIKYNAQHLGSVYDKSKAGEKRMKTSNAKGFWNYVFARTSVLAMHHKGYQGTENRQ